MVCVCVCVCVWGVGGDGVNEINMRGVGEEFLKL